MGSKPDGKLKSEISTSKIQAVEDVPFEAFSRPFMLQVVHTESILYIQCQSVKSHDEWLRALREQVKGLSTLNANFHPGFFDGKWTCCSISDHTLDGCQPAFDYQYVARALSLSRVLPCFCDSTRPRPGLWYHSSVPYFPFFFLRTFQLSKIGRTASVSPRKPSDPLPPPGGVGNGTPPAQPTPTPSLNACTHALADFHLGLKLYFAPRS